MVISTRLAYSLPRRYESIASSPVFTSLALYSKLPCGLFCLLTVVSAGNVSADQAASREALANERFPVNAQRMEEQWGVDCDAALTQIRMLATTSKQTDAKYHARQEALSSTLERCGFIYNTSGAQLYTACPQYQQWHQWLQQKAEMPTACR